VKRPPTERASSLTASVLLARNAGWSLAGNLLPLLVAIACVPVLVRGLGSEKFGLLSVIWVVVGYFAVFDLGFGRALTKLVAERLGHEKSEEIPDLVVTALGIVTCLGLLAACLIATISPWLIRDVLKTPNGLVADGTIAFWVLSAGLPFLIVSGALIGFLQAHQRFRAFSAIRMLTGSLTFAGPALALIWTPSVAAAAASITVSRALAVVVYGLYCFRAFPEVWHDGRFRKRLVKPLLDFGGWFTVSNVLGPIMVYLDRFVIGAVLSLSAVAYYTTPYEAVTRLSMFPTALVNVLFPAFTTSFVADRERLVRLYDAGWKLVLIAMGPVAALIVLFAPEGLSLWVGPDFASRSTSVMRWLVVGVLVNSLARLPAALVQGAGRPDLVAKLHVAELPLYLTGMWWALHVFGLVGVAAAWTVRIAVDTLALFVMGARLVPTVGRTTGACLLGTLVIACGVGVLSVVSTLTVKVVIAVSVLLGALTIASYQVHRDGWDVLLQLVGRARVDSEERA